MLITLSRYLIDAKPDPQNFAIDEQSVEGFGYDEPRTGRRFGGDDLITDNDDDFDPPGISGRFFGLGRFQWMKSSSQNWNKSILFGAIAFIHMNALRLFKNYAYRCIITCIKSINFILY